MATTVYENPGNGSPVNISEGLDPKLYFYQMISPLGGYVSYAIVTGNTFPDEPPRGHLLLKHQTVQLKPDATTSIWCWAGSDCLLVVTEASSLKAL